MYWKKVIGLQYLLAPYKMQVESLLYLFYYAHEVGQNVGKSLAICRISETPNGLTTIQTPLSCLHMKIIGLFRLKHENET